MLTLNYPQKQSVAFSNTLFRLYEIAKDTDEDEINFDLSRSESLTPFGIIMLTATVAECLHRRKQCLYQAPQKSEFKRFLTDIGFHEYFGLADKQGKGVGNIIETGAVQLRRVDGLNPMIIDTLIEILDYHLKISPGVKGSLQMSLLETMQNVVDHSEVESYYICCWNYPYKREIRLCITDLGIGIRASLAKNKEYASLTNHHEAIIRATDEGVSSRSGRDGLGLAHIKQFLRVNKGRMCIISGRGKVFWKFDQGKMLKQSMSQFFNGTIVKLIINTGKEGFYFLTSEEEYLF